uniref:Rhodanese domain-containing protein n=1 Tax=Phaeomonas parva TaxID=124430 RepID=A0A7S1UJH7_9STRA|mmetsp:Transcript_55/g.192  ORF Transcript_55/g.192 Transcript_55/m.192 type:complete len:478 (+) Transcript_55:148-1581(+)|eukprot:CAMPEP_0118879400 /NCGR_PEP_ID=MMETSP1163-20130328/19212_1 /TAXON_ID=124430 /ORGANISM="Phaeomonas parva, Strain CCMP2877" /LENGTH=477 /DNA_ID=CAMNT_0006815549 /DNA_START=78 /DNA_END=1511 /DNA_ORIENTATION=-
MEGKEPAPEPARELPRALPLAGGLAPEEIARYSRQMLVPALGRGFQEALKAGAVLVVGAGGLGATIMPYLVGMGVGKVTVCDDDVVEITNLHRQVLFTEEAAAKRTPKAEAVRAFCDNLNSSVEVKILQRRFTPDVADATLKADCCCGVEPDVIIDATDNLPSRYAVNDACVRHGIPLVLGASVGIEGQLSIYNYNGGPCLRCVHPFPKGNNKAPTCADSGVLGAVPGLMGCLQAIEAVKLLAKLKDPAGAPSLKVRNQMLHYHATTGNFHSFRMPPKRPDCALCGKPNAIIPLNVPAACSGGSFAAAQLASTLSDDSRITPQAFAAAWGLDRGGDDENEHAEANANGEGSRKRQKIDDAGSSVFTFTSRQGDGARAALLDVRNATQRGIIAIEGSISMPLKQLRKRLEKPGAAPDAVLEQLRNKPAASKCFVMCRRGVDSVHATKLLMEHGIQGVVNIEGGLTAWARDVDETFPMY